MSSAAGGERRATPGVRHRGRQHFATALVILAYAPVDALLVGRFVPSLVALRLAWAGAVAVAGALTQRIRSARARTLLSVPVLALAPLFQLALARGTGGVGNPTYAWLVAMPLAIAMMAQEQVWATALAGASAVASTAVAVAWAGAPPREVVAWALLVGLAAAHGIFGSLSFRRRKRAERASVQARLEAEARLAESERRRAQSEHLALLGRVAAGVAHEVNNPLAYVSANLSFVQDELRDPTVSRAELDAVFEESRQGVQRIEHIVRSLRAFGRDDAPAEDASRVDEVVAEAIRVAAAKLGRAEPFEVVIAGDLPPVLVPRGRLLDVLLHLLLNAVDAVEEAGGRPAPAIHVRAARCAGGVEIAVDDDGPGLAPDALQRLFEPFFTTKAPRRGTGLGLAASREHLARHGARIEGMNRPGGGARFVLWLPEEAREAGQSNRAAYASS
jgi:signal transduction histidine kinase